MCRKCEKARAECDTEVKLALEIYEKAWGLAISKKYEKIMKVRHS